MLGLKKRQYVKGDKVITEVLIPRGSRIILPKNNLPDDYGYVSKVDIWVNDDEVIEVKGEE